MNPAIVSEVDLLAAENDPSIPVDEMSSVELDLDAIRGKLVDDLLGKYLAAFRDDLGESESRAKWDIRIFSEVGIEDHCGSQGRPDSGIETCPVTGRFRVVYGTQDL